jgi:WD40 repeat protein
MPITISRRRWLLSATVATVSLSPIAAEPPSTPLGLRIASSSMPIPTRTIRLRSPGDIRSVVTSIAADPRGEFVAAAGDDHSIRILRMSDLSTLRTLQGHRDVIRTLAFDPAGSRLVSAGNDGQLIVWNRDKSFRVHQRIQETPALARVRFSPDGSELAAVGFANEVYVLGRSDRERRIFRCNCNDLRAVAYRDDNQLLAVAGRSGDLHLFDPQSGLLLSDHALHRGRIHDIAFHRQTNVAVCVAEDGCVTLFDTANRRLVRRIPVASGKLFAVAVLDPQLIAVAGSDNVIRVVNTDDGTVIRKLEGHVGSVSTLALSGGVLFSGGYDASVRRWSIGDAELPQQRIAEGDVKFDR